MSKPTTTRADACGDSAVTQYPRYYRHPVPTVLQAVTPFSDPEGSSDESDCSLVTVYSFTASTPRKRKRHSNRGEKAAAKQNREEGN